MVRTESEIEEIINRMIKGWFYTSPYLYKKICNNPVYKNKKMLCEARSGKNRIEYNPELIKEKTPGEIKDLIKLELSRIILGHCTFRRPNPFNAEIAIKASNMAILQKNLGNLPEGQSFEFYYDALMKENQNDEDEDDDNGGGDASAGDCNDGMENMSGTENNDSEDQTDNSNSSGKSETEDGKNAKTDTEQNTGLESAAGDAEKDAVELWNKDDAVAELEAQMDRQELLEKKEFSEELSGILPGTMAGGFLSSLIIEKEKVSNKFNVLKIFISAIQKGKKRVGTRSKPNRRFGYHLLGTRLEKDNFSLLCVLDVSKSVKDKWLVLYANYLNYIRRKYKCQIDVIEADIEIKEDSLFRMKSEIKILKCEGRGGTDFQCVIDYVEKNKRKYDGVIVFTDGYFEHLEIPKNFNMRILWALNEPDPWFKNHFPKEKYVAYLKDTKPLKRGV